MIKTDFLGTNTFYNGDIMLITSLEKNKRSNGQVSLYVDGQYLFSVPEEVYLSMGLYEKREISQDEINYIKNNVHLRSAKSVALRSLSLKLKSEQEVVKKLEMEGYDGETVENVVEYLKSLGYINDKIYAQKYIYDRSKLKPKAKKMLKMELLQKGVAESIIDEVLEDWEIDEQTLAEGLVRRKYGKYDLKDEKILRRMCSYLAHRGFSYELIHQIVNKIKRDGKI